MAGKKTEQPENGKYACSRRALLKGALGSSLAAAGALGFAAEVGAAASSRDKTTQWDEALDIVVIGSGFAGLAAAAAAADQGMKVVVLEKMPHYGGNSVISHGEYAAWDDEYHLRQKLNLGGRQRNAAWGGHAPGGEFLW